MNQGYELSVQDEVVHLKLDMGKANAIGEAFLERFHQALEEAEAASPCGLVLTGAGGFFSAGLNLVELAPLDRDAMAAFMGRFRDAMVRLLAFPGRTVAAINGHAVAGGAVLACACDIRLAVIGDYKIGVRETALGVGLPRCAMEILRRALPADRLEEVVLFGRLYDPEEALEMGMVHELVRPHRLEAAAERRARRDRDVPRAALAQVRRGLVAPWVDRIRNGGDDEDWVDTWFSEEAQRLIGEALERLR